jgi:DNA-binding transcriptional ArsR family regulator
MEISNSFTKPMPEFNPPASIFKALMHPSRLSILEILRDGEHCVCHLEAVLGCRQAYISQHLMVLREAGLVEDRRDGARIYYRVVKPEIYDLVDAAVRLSGMKPMPVFDTKIQNCPCPKCNPVVEITIIREEAL